MILAGAVVESARLSLFDPAPGIGWTTPELVLYLIEGILETALVKTDVYPVRAALTPTAGIMQTLPDGGLALIDITHNVASGRVVTVTDLALLQEANRFYPGATQQAEVENFAVDPRDPRRYTVFPPNDGTGSIFVIYGATPPLPADVDAEIPLLDVYFPALVSFVLSRAYAKASKRQDLSKAGAYRQQWAQALGMKSVSTLGAVPHVSQSPGL